MTSNYIETVWSAHVTAEMVKHLSDSERYELFEALNDMVAHTCAEFRAEETQEKFYTVTYTEQQVYSLTIEAATAEDALRIARGLPIDDNWLDVGVVDSFYKLESN